MITPEDLTYLPIFITVYWIFASFAGEWQDRQMIAEYVTGKVKSGQKEYTIISIEHVIPDERYD